MKVRMPQLLYDETHFAQLVLATTKFIDVRAPCEFQDGCIPGAVNLPLLDDEQRHKVGTCFKKDGQAAAMALGNSLVEGRLRLSRLNGWRDFVLAHPDAIIYCARGGLRSQLVVGALRQEFGLDVPMIRGGYKAFRQFLLSVNEQVPQRESFLVVTGRTGCGKTEILEKLATQRRVLDLEALAHHRGSAFGRRRKKQPRVADFENHLAAQLLGLQSRNVGDGNDRRKFILIEDESRLIGYLTIPPHLFRQICSSDMVLIEEDDESRVDLLLQMYMTQDYAFTGKALDESFSETERLAQELRRALQSIANRLGGTRTQECFALLESGLAHQLATGSTAGHRPWISYLLKNYYDPMYDMHIEHNLHRIRFRGTRQEVLQYLS